MYVLVGELVLVGDHSTVPLTRISCNTVFSKSQNPCKAGTLCTVKLVLAEHHALYTRFLPKPSRKVSNAPKLKGLLSNLYTVFSHEISELSAKDFCRPNFKVLVLVENLSKFVMSSPQVEQVSTFLKF